MDDLIPLLIVIAISIIGAVNQNKKRKERINIASQDKHPRQDNEFFNWLEKLGVEEEGTLPISEERPFMEPFHKTVVKEAPVEVKVNEPVKEILPGKYAQFAGFITPEEREQIMAKEGVSSLKPKKDINDLTYKPDEDTENAVDKQKIDFNLKQAVIFSEILNRKYV